MMCENPERINDFHRWCCRLLRVKLDVAIQSVRILREVSLELPTGTMAGLIGRNGTGGHVAGCG